MGVYCLRVWSRGHQVRGHPCKLEKFALHAKIYQKTYFSIDFISKKRWIESTSPHIKKAQFQPPIKTKVKQRGCVLELKCRLLDFNFYQFMQARYD